MAPRFMLLTGACRLVLTMGVSPCHNANAETMVNAIIIRRGLTVVDGEKGGD